MTSSFVSQTREHSRFLITEQGRNLDSTARDSVLLSQIHFSWSFLLKNFITQFLRLSDKIFSMFAQKLDFSLYLICFTFFFCQSAIFFVFSVGERGDYQPVVGVAREEKYFFMSPKEKAFFCGGKKMEDLRASKGGKKSCLCSLYTDL